MSNKVDWNARIESKLDSVKEDIGKIKITQAEQHITLSEHTKRSTMLEEIVLPMHRKFTMVEGVFKFIGVLSVLAAIAEAIAVWIKH